MSVFSEPIQLSNVIRQQLGMKGTGIDILIAMRHRRGRAVPVPELSFRVWLAEQIHRRKNFERQGIQSGGGVGINIYRCPFPRFEIPIAKKTKFYNRKARKCVKS